MSKINFNLPASAPPKIPGDANLSSARISTLYPTRTLGPYSSWKNHVKMASTANIDLLLVEYVNYITQLDSVIPLVGDRILLKNQTLPVENGIYTVVSLDSWQRSSDLDINSNAASIVVIVNQGLLNENKVFSCVNTTATALVGTDPLTFSSLSEVAMIDDNTLNAVVYPTWTPVTSGIISNLYISSTQLYFRPSTGKLSSKIIEATQSIPSTSSVVGSILSTGGIGVSESTDATSYTNGGGLTIAGGAAIAKKLFVGDSIQVRNYLKLEDLGSGNFVSMKSPSIPASYTLTFPPDAGTTGQTLTTNGTGILSWSTLGDVTGPGSSTDTAIALFDGITGKLIKNSVVLVSPAGIITGVNSITASGNITSTTGNIISTTGTVSASTGITATTGNITATAGNITAPLGNISGVTLTSTVSTGTSPFTVSSTTQVPNLKASTAATADNVITNANLTGVITSVGNATSINSQTGTGSTFVVQTSPTINSPSLTTPSIGVATGTSLDVTGTLKTRTSLILEDPNAGTDTITLQAPTLSSSYTLTLPVDDGINSQVLTTNGSGVLTWSVPAGGGNVTGPGSSTSTAIALYNGITGQLLQNSVVLISGLGAVTGITDITISNSLLLEDPGAGTNTITLISPTPLASSYTLTLPPNDGAVGQVLTTDGSGVTTWSTPAGGGNVLNAGASTDTAVATFNGTSGTAIQNSVVLVSPAGIVTGVTDITLKNSLLLEDPGAGTNTITIQAPTLSSSYTLTFPVDDGTSGQALTTNGSGTLSWTSLTSGDVVGPGSSVDNQIALFNGTTGKLIKTSSILITSSDISGLNNITLSGTFATSGLVSSTNTTDSTSIATGSINTAGGIGIAKKLFVGETITAVTTITAGSTITATTGNIVATAGNITAGGSVTATGLMSAGTTITAGSTITATSGGITATAGNIAASSGNITASGNVTASGNLLSDTGCTLGQTASSVNNIGFVASSQVRLGSSSSTMGFFGATAIARPTTAIASVAIVPGAGSNIKDDSTFNGYTIAQIVKALQNVGLLT